MSETIFHDFYKLARKVSIYLPLSDGMPLDQEITSYADNTPITKLQGEHWAIVSKTGNGKTTLGKALIAAYRVKYPWLNTYILDTKKQGDFSDKDGKLYNSYDPPPLLSGIGQKQIWQPVIDDIDSYDRYFTNILNAGKPCIVFIDESKNLKIGGRAPRGYDLLLSQGRLPGIFTITNMQEVANSLRQAISQATHIISFSVRNEYDERMMKSYLHLPLREPMPLKGRFSFMYLNSNTSNIPILYNDYRQFITAFKSW